MKLKLMTLAILAIMATGQSCKKHDPHPSTDLLVEKIAKAWKPQMVVKDAIDVTNTFQQMIITFATDNTYTTHDEVPPIWNASGLFAIEDRDGAKTLLIDNALSMEIIEITDTKLVLKYQYDTPGNGRVSSISGQFTFTFAPA